MKSAGSVATRVKKRTGVFRVIMKRVSVHAQENNIKMFGKSTDAHDAELRGEKVKYNMHISSIYKYNNTMLVNVSPETGEVYVVLPDGTPMTGKGRDVYRTLLNIADEIRHKFREVGLDFQLDMRSDEKFRW